MVIYHMNKLRMGSIFTFQENITLKVKVISRI